MKPYSTDRYLIKAYVTVLDVKFCITEKAKSFWENVDVDRVFDELLQHLVRLRESIKTNTASDKGKHMLGL